ncbi:MAG: polysaccharide biosynthesis/export family protein [Bacteroidales bacterium]|nr:polysaccharide biosynthesis/export family protein [Bacteroidales bacterium]
MRKKIFLISNLFFLIGILVLSSCTPLKRMNYMQDKESSKEVKNNKATYNYKLQPRDVVYIRVLSIDEKLSKFFNVGDNSSAYTTNMGVYISSFSVNDSGYVELPIVGKTLVRGLTLEEARSAVQKSINEYLNQATVIIKLVNFNVSVIGEVTRPGNFPILDEKVNIFQILGMAGDLTIYGNREKVMLIRTTNEGTNTFYIDLTDKNIINSEYFYLMPNDVIYVSTLKTKPLGFGTFPFSTILSAVTTFLLILNFMKVK